MTLAEVWNGASWTVQTTPNPSGATDSDLDAVSCRSATACTAVGAYESRSGAQVTLAEVWNGNSWTVRTTPNPKGATDSGLDGVACRSATACTAVGEYKSSSGAFETLVEVWNGTSWTVQTTPNPKGALGSHLDAVSCSSATACTAVGTYQSSYGAEVTLGEVWNGTSWTVQATANPSGASYSDLYAVSCTSATACTAVGGSGNSSGTSETLAEVWNGTSWAVQTTPNPSGAVFGSELDAVSCRSAIACTAVGAYQGSSSASEMLAEVRNGTSWAMQTTPNPSGATDSDLDAVSCGSAAACTA
ncbi:MAG: hypothetical protein ABSC41_18820, partial [Acidimicrobiales bacterium]